MPLCNSQQVSYTIPRKVMLKIKSIMSAKQPSNLNFYIDTGKDKFHYLQGTQSIRSFRNSWPRD